MSVRKKSKLERLLSFNQYRRRRGASDVEKQLSKVDFSQLKHSTINDVELNYTYGSKKSLNEHIDNLRAEFSGQPELLHYHATLIVLLRRDYKSEDQFHDFVALWEAEGDFLLSKLNTRWLVSAADTFADHSDDKSERAIALSVSLLMNTIKLQETERYLQCAESLADNDERKTELQTQRVPLFDGTSAFAVGTDDTVRNMCWRMKEVLQEETTCSKLLSEIFVRLQSEETVYKRFRDKHTRKKTIWW